MVEILLKRKTNGITYKRKIKVNIDFLCLYGKCKPFQYIFGFPSWINIVILMLKKEEKAVKLNHTWWCISHLLMQKFLQEEVICIQQMFSFSIKFSLTFQGYFDYVLLECAILPKIRKWMISNIRWSYKKKVKLIIGKFDLHFENVLHEFKIWKKSICRLNQRKIFCNML